MAQPAAAPAGLQAALQQHANVKKATELPLFYGNPRKDTISARDLIKRLEKAATTAGWNTDAQKLTQLYLILREDAIVWWDSLADQEIDSENDYNRVKTEFITDFEPKVTARTTCTNLAELHQRPGEPVNAFYLRLFATYRRLCEARPADMNDVKLVPAVAAAATAAEQRLIKQEGIKDMEMYLKHQLLMAGLRDPYRAEAMKEGKANIRETVKFVADLEAINGKNQANGLRPGIAAVSEGIDDNEVTEDIETAEHLEAADIEAINALRRRAGKPPFRSGPKKTITFNGQQNGVICRYCKKKGHMQRECRSRQRDKAPMVDAAGKPFTKKVNVVEDREADDEAVKVGSITPGLGLNWV